MPTEAQQRATEEAVQLALDRQELANLRATVAELKADRDKFLKWGVIVLGGAVVGLVTWIFNLITRHN